MPLKNLTPSKRHRDSHKPDTEDQLPPHSIEAEQGVLGCILSDPSCLYAAEQRIRDRAAFYDLKHQFMWDAFVAAGKNGGIDIITTGEYLKKARRFTEVGGDAYLVQVQESIPSTANLSYYLDILEEKWQLRRTIQMCTEVSNRAMSYTGSIEDFIYASRSDLTSILSGYQEKKRGQILKPSTLSEFNTQSDPNNLIGGRWLCRAGKCLIVGPSGRGKSTLNMQMAIMWAMGKPFMGIAPTKPLQQVIIGDENDVGDLAEMFQGVCKGLQIDPFEHGSDYELLNKNLTFFNCPALSGDKFIAAIQNWIEQNPVDLAWLDPLVSFADEDITRQEGAAHFLRHGLSRISSETGVCWMVIHHTPKTSRDPRAGKSWGTSDYQYAGAGSYDLAGWARATITLREVKDGCFCLVLSKRGERAGATHPDGSLANRKLWLRHSTEGIYWEQIEPPEQSAEENRPKGGQPSKVDKIIALGLGGIIDGVKSPTGKNELARIILDFSTAQRVDVKISTCKLVVERLFENGVLNKKDEKYTKL